MKYLLSIIILIILPSVSLAKEISLPETGITFIAPDEFKPLPQKIIDIKWPSKRAPKWVIGNKDATTTIAYDLKPNDISQAPLPALIGSFENVFNRVVPGIKWKKKEIIKLSGQQWIYLEMTSNAIDTDIHNIMLVTSYKKRMLVFNFNSTKQDFAKYEAILRKSIETIKLPPQ